MTVAFSILVAFSATASAANWYVDDGGNNSNGGMSPGDAWRDISYAIGNASVSDGDTIMVGGGTYNESIVVDKELTIMAASIPIIDGQGTIYGPAVHVQADNVTFEGFTIRNFISVDTNISDMGGIFVEGGNAVINNNTIEYINNVSANPAGIGIDVWTESGANTNIQVTNNTVHDVGSIGIRVRDDWRLCGFGSYPPCVFTGSTGISRNVLVEGNTVFRANNSNILITGFAEGVTVRDNEIYDSSDPNRYGIRLCIYPSNVTIDKNYIHGNYRNIVIAGADDVTISNNTIENTSSSSKNIYIMNNYNIDNGQPWPEVLGGITVNTTSTNISITNNDILNAGYGVKIENFGASDPSQMATTTTINFNNIVGNTEYGVENQIATDVDAECNWWGHASGPSGPDGRTNKKGKEIGKGDAVSANVDWDPWLPQPVRHTPHDPVPPGLRKGK